MRRRLADGQLNNRVPHGCGENEADEEKRESGLQGKKEENMKRMGTLSHQVAE